MALYDLAQARRNEACERLEEIHTTTRRLLALGEERLDLERRALTAQDTQSLIGYLQLQVAQGNDPDPSLLRTVQERLRL